MWLRIETLSKRGRQRQRREARKIFLRNPRILLSISLLWLHCMFLFSLKLLWLQHLFLNETMDVLKTAWKWSSWSLIWEQDGTNVNFISHIHVRFLSSVSSLIVLPTLPSPSSAVSWHGKPHDDETTSGTLLGISLSKNVVAVLLRNLFCFLVLSPRTSYMEHQAMRQSTWTRLSLPPFKPMRTVSSKSFPKDSRRL